MPHLRKLAAPARRLHSDLHPFVFQAADLQKEDLGLAIVDQPLVQLIICEAERAYANSLRLQSFLQGDSEKLQKVSFQQIRRRQIQNLKRALERAETLVLIGERYGTSSFKLQSTIYKLSINGVLE